VRNASRRSGGDEITTICAVKSPGQAGSQRIKIQSAQKENKQEGDDHSGYTVHHFNQYAVYFKWNLEMAMILQSYT
jgi:hypothetical protein